MFTTAMHRSAARRPPAVRRLPLLAAHAALAAALATLTASASRAQSLEDQLLAAPLAQLARDAATSGDPQRGAVLFHQPYLACSQCHAWEDPQPQLGPNLAQAEPKLSDTDLVDALLRPSQEIRQGFETTQVELHSGRTLLGRVVEEHDQSIVLCDASKQFAPVEIARSDIAQATVSPLSTMPAGQMRALTSRQQFLDLVRYLMEVRDGGLARARQLQPPPALYAPAELPAYEAQIDHAGMIRSLDEAAFARGAAIYQRVCANCHGTHEQPGSLPTSPRFASGTLKNGHDPFAIYQTLTRGFGMMVPQTWMVPRQKYDVIHYIREAYLQQHNPSHYFPVDDHYLASLPRGDSQGPEPRESQPWREMDYGPHLTATYEVGEEGTNFAFKGHAVRLDPGPGGISRGAAWMLFDSDTLRMAAAWTGSEFIDYRGINFDGAHACHPRVTGRVHFANPTGPGWARPGTDAFDDSRPRGRDGRAYGPLPRAWGQYRGVYAHGNETIISYTVGETPILETHTVVDVGSTVFGRQFEIGSRGQELLLQVAHLPEAAGRPLQAVALPAGASRALARTHQWGDSILVGLAASDPADVAGCSWSVAGDNLRLRLPPGREPLRFTLWMTRLDASQRLGDCLTALWLPAPSRDLSSLTLGGPDRWPDTIHTAAQRGTDEGPFAVDTLTCPLTNPWLCRMRLTGHDFFSDGDRAAICDWDGNVWLVAGLSALDTPAATPARLAWKRIASGLFQPLGLRIINDVIHVTCRDQLCRLHDLNGDAGIDWYECVNHDHQVTEHFHEFAMGLQTDAEGNFYYAKSARHALPAVVPQHGTLLRVSSDGQQTEIVARGFRAANGVCINPDGTFIVTDQEGHWTPKNRLNWVRPGGFYGNMFAYHDVVDASDAAMEKPLCWVTNAFERSPAEPLWVESSRWGPLQGSLLSISYGYGKLFLVPHEFVQGQAQGGLIELPIPQFPTGIMRGRFHPVDGQLYVSGMFGWGGNQELPGGFYRVRSTGQPLHLPLGLHVSRQGLELTFSGDLDAEVAARVENYDIKVWDLRRSANYGSEHYDERPVAVTRATLHGRRLTLEVSQLQPTWCMEIRYRLQTSSGAPCRGTLHNTIHSCDDLPRRPSAGPH